MAGIGKILVLTGIIIILVGLVLWLGSETMSWFGNLPGDISIKKENFRFYFPITSMIIFSVLLSLIIWIIKRLF